MDGIVLSHHDEKSQFLFKPHNVYCWNYRDLKIAFSWYQLELFHKAKDIEFNNPVETFIPLLNEKCCVDLLLMQMTGQFSGMKWNISIENDKIPTFYSDLEYNDYIKYLSMSVIQEENKSINKNCSEIPNVSSRKCDCDDGGSGIFDESNTTDNNNLSTNSSGFGIPGLVENGRIPTLEEEVALDYSSDSSSLSEKPSLESCKHNDFAEEWEIDTGELSLNLDAYIISDMEKIIGDQNKRITSLEQRVANGKLSVEFLTKTYNTLIKSYTQEIALLKSILREKNGQILTLKLSKS